MIKETKTTTHNIKVVIIFIKKVIYILKEAVKEVFKIIKETVKDIIGLKDGIIKELVRVIYWGIIIFFAIKIIKTFWYL